MNPDTHDLNLPDTATTQPAKRTGRPPVWTAELIAEHKTALINHVIAGQSVTSYVQQDGNPGWDTVYKWMDEDQTFNEEFERARIRSAHSHADRAVHISELVQAKQLDANAARVIIDEAKWTAGTRMPRTYGPKVDHTIEGTITHKPQWLWGIDLTDDRQAVTRTSVGALPGRDISTGNGENDLPDVVGASDPTL